MKIKTIISTILLCFAFVGNAFARYEQELIMACEMGNVRDAEKYLEWGANPNVTKQEGEYIWSALALACKNGNLNLVKALVKKGASVNGQDETGWIAPVAIASKNAHTPIVNYLLESGASLNGVDDEGDTAFMNLIEKGLDAVCIKHVGKVSLNIRNENTGHNALSYIVMYRKDKLLDALLGHNSHKNGLVDLNPYIESERCTLFQLAMKKQNTHAIQVLLSENYDNVTLQDSEGLPPLLWGIRERVGYLSLEKLLELAPESVIATDRSGKDVYTYLKKYPYQGIAKTKIDQAIADAIDKVY